MQSCTLCGGKVVNGKCRECGLDNTKNDKKYRLNQHGEKDTVFVHDRCEDGVNKERKPQKTKTKQTAQPVKQAKPAKKKKGGHLFRWCILIVLLVALFPVILTFLIDVFEEPETTTRIERMKEEIEEKVKEDIKEDVVYEDTGKKIVVTLPKRNK